LRRGASAAEARQVRLILAQVWPRYKVSTEGA